MYICLLFNQAYNLRFNARLYEVKYSLSLLLVSKEENTPQEVDYIFDYYNVDTQQIEAVITTIPVWMADYIDSIKNQLIEAKYNYHLFTSVKET